MDKKDLEVLQKFANLLANKINSLFVTKVPGKDLSTNDYTNEDKEKVTVGIPNLYSKVITNEEDIKNMNLIVNQNKNNIDIVSSKVDDVELDVKEYTDTKIANLVGTAPETLDTLEEIADALEENADVVQALNDAIGTKASQTELDTHINNNTIHVTSTEKSNWNVPVTKEEGNKNKVWGTDENGNPGWRENSGTTGGGTSLPSGGTTGQILSKASDADGDAIWKNLNAEANFLTSGGFGNLRYLNGKFQYYDTATETWVDTAATPDNVIVVNMMPNPMQRIIGIYDHEIGKNKLKWLEPEDTVVDGQVICLVEKVVIRRKLGSAPQNENDGDLVITVEREDFGSHDTEWWFDNSVTPTLGDTWHYKAFPIATTGFANGSSINQCTILAKDHYLFGFTIKNGEPDTKSMMELVEDCKGFHYAGMDYAADVFNYGDWKDFWFIRDCKPCMLNYDGTVAYFLDKNNKKLKEDGTPSDVNNPDFDGNAMNQNPATYWGFTLNEDGSGTYLFSDKLLDGFKYYQNLDENGNFTPYWYTPCYPGVVIDGVMRSLSGYMPTTNLTRQQEIDYAVANNKNGEHVWYTEVMCDRQLLDLLMLLIGGDTNTQTVYGSGNNNSYIDDSSTGVKKSGLLDDKGMFYGKNDNVSQMCAFGILDYYGNAWRAKAGHINDHGTQKIKMTYGQSDSSTVDGYNTTGAGYITIQNATSSGTNSGYISKMKFTENGLIPITASGSATTYYADGLWFNNSQVNYTVIGGSSANNLTVGAFCVNDGVADFLKSWSIGASLSCKPLAQTGGES